MSSDASSSSSLWILGAVVLLVVAGFLGWWWWTREKEEKGVNSERNPSTSYPAKSKSIAQAASVPGQNFVMPMRYHPGWGEFVVQISLSGTDFEVVPDSGSEILVVAGQGCQGCNQNELGVWPQPAQEGQMHSIVYGSQSVKFQWTQGNLSGASKPIAFGAIYSASSSSGPVMNIMGLQPTAASWSRYTILQQLAANEGIEEVITFDYPKQLFALGAYDIPAGAAWAPLLSTSAAQQLAQKPMTIPFYMIDVSQSPQLASTGVKVAIIDTGTTDTLIPSSALSVVKREGLDLIFSNGQKISWTPAQAQQFVTPTAPADTQQWGTAVMLIGNRWLQRYGVQFDINQQRIVFF